MVGFHSYFNNTLHMASLFFLIVFHALDAAPLVDALVDSKSNQVNFPLEGTITITHSKEEKIDSQSFLIEGKALDASLVKEVKMSPSSDTLVSIYSFKLPAKPEGFYLLPPISVKINNNPFSSPASSYELRANTDSQALGSKNEVHSTSSSPVIFRLEASVDGPTTLYPGERTKFRYRIIYNRSVDLTTSLLPLVHPEHFQKVGDVQIKDYQLQSTTVQELTQEVEASELGTFSFGPSQVEGHAYIERNGQKIYDSTLLKAEAKALTVQVKPFPLNIQPISFTGALGKIEVKSHLNSTKTVMVGDAIELTIAMSGVTNLADATLPNLQCQPGFSGFFQMSDIPPLSEVKGDVKLFYVELIPLNDLIDKIPSIELSSFDQESKQYIVKITDPIPLKIEESALALMPVPPIPFLNQISFIEKWPDPMIKPLKMEFTSTATVDLTHDIVKGRWVVWTLLLASILLALQKYQKKKKSEYTTALEQKSEILFKQASKSGNLHEMEQAFWQLLWERDVVPRGVLQLQSLKNQEAFADVCSFIYKLQSLQYSENKSFDSILLEKEAKKCFERVN